MSDTTRQIDEQVRVQRSDGTEDVRQLVADLLKEYVADGGSAALAAQVRTLPTPNDDLERDFGLGIYDSMMLDPEVGSSVNTLKGSVIDGGVHTVPAPVAEDDPAGADVASEISAFVQASIDGMDTPMDDVLWDLLDALRYGHRIGELIFAFSTGPWNGERITLAGVHIKEREDVAFAVDRFNRIVGFVPTKGKHSGQALGTNWQEQVLPAEKFTWMTFRPRGNDPRGTSILRSAYNAWWLKQQLYPEWLKYLAQFATGMLIGFTPENTKDSYKRNPDGSLAVDSQNSPIKITPEEVMLSRLVEMRNGSAAVFPHGAAVDVHASSGDGAAFLATFAELDRWISKAILHQTLATNEGEHQARAAAEVHKTILDMLTALVESQVARVLRRDVFWPLVKYNWGEEIASRYTPFAVLGNVDRSNFQAYAPGAAQLYSAGYFHPSQLAAMDSYLGLPARPADDVVLPEAASEADDGRA